MGQTWCWIKVGRHSEGKGRCERQIVGTCLQGRPENLEMLEVNR